jgi:branched-chain amino acid aminotransferase
MKIIISSAKACGYYLNSIFATFDAEANKFDESVLLDYRGFVTEGPGENIFIVKNKKLFTPKLGNILPGITRNSIIKIAKDLKIKVLEKDISVRELKNCDEAFFTGTAAEITPIIQIDNKTINNKEIGEITKNLQDKFYKIINGEDKKYQNWFIYLN